MQEREFSFNKTLEEETKQMALIAKKLTQRGEYQKKFKEIQKYQDEEDPKILFYQECSS